MAQSIYQYNMHQEFNQHHITEQNLPNPNEFFHINLHFHHVLELSYPESIRIPINTINKTLTLPYRQFFLSQVFLPRSIERILVDTGVSRDFIEEVIPIISSFALEMVTNNNNNGTGNNLPRVLCMVLDVFVVTPYDDREAIDRALEEVSTIQESNNGDVKFKAASRSCIDGLKRVRVESLIGSLPAKKCMVCLEDMLMDDESICLPCGHVFHGDCIVKWLETSHLCPLCRFPMPS